MSPLPGPILLIALPLLAAGLAYVLRRWSPVAALLAVVTAGALALLCLRLPLDRAALVLGQEIAFGQPIIIVGRTLVLDPSGQIWLAFVFGMSAVLFLVAWPLPQGRSFYPFGLAILSLYVLVILLQTFSLAILAFAISVTLAIFVIQSESSASVRGAQRYLLVTLLAVPLLLAAAWLLEATLPISGSGQLARQALLPALLGFGLLVAVFPFGTWMPALAADAPPLATAFVFTCGQAIALYLMLSFLHDAPWIVRDPLTPTVLPLAGLVMVVSGGVMAAVQSDFGRLFGYAALSDLGFLLLALVTGGSQGQALALLHTTSRALTITLYAAALATIRMRASTDHFARLGGVARRLPVAMMGLLVGGLALAGFPLTAGFPIHWAVARQTWNWAQPLSTLAEQTSAGASNTAGGLWPAVLVVAALLASSVGIVIGMLRGLSAALGDTSRQDMERQPFIASLLILLLIGIVIFLGLFPQLFLEPVLEITQASPLF